MQTRYQLLKANEETMFSFVKAGILSYQIIRDCEIYEQFIQLGDEISSQAKYLILGSDYELSSKRIEQIINTMSQ